MAIKNIIFVYHQDDRNLTIGNYYADAAKSLNLPFSWTSPEHVPHVCSKNGFDILIKIDDGHHDPIEYNKFARKSAFVFIDSHTDFSRGLNIARNFDKTFCAQKQGCTLLEKYSIPNEWLPCACDPNVHTSIYTSLADRPFDVGFAGSLRSSHNTNRRHFVQFLHDTYGNRALVSDSNRGQLSLINGSCKVVINQLCRNDINMRFFEATSAGAILLTEDVVDNGLEEIGFPEDCFFVYKSLSEIPKAISHILNISIDSLDEKAKRMQEFVQNYHSYKFRLLSILNSF